MQEEIQEKIYVIKTINFEGPFHLLLNLIEKRKFFINDLSLAQVTDDYLAFLNKLGKMELAEVSSFIVIASTLILIKSKSLLPNLILDIEEEKNIEDLEKRLKLYKFFLELSENIKNNFGKKIIFTPQEKKIKLLVFLPDDQITKDSMMTFAQNVLNKIPKKNVLSEISVKKVINIDEMIEKLTERIQNSLKISFKDSMCLSSNYELNATVSCETKREEKIIFIVGFLAMLELVRQGILNVVQENHLGDIMIEKN
ncbi:MAG: segregation/condensation protein A [Patescibacteria group bacterium]